MKKYWVVALVVMGYALTAQAWEKGQLQQKIADRKVVDQNGSGTISESEATAAYSAGEERRKEMFKAGDLNHDGYVTSDELKDPKAFAQMDANNDGRISENEYLAWHLKASANAYDKTDSNNDKAVSAQEMENAIQKRINERKSKK